MNILKFIRTETVNKYMYMYPVWHLFTFVEGATIGMSAEERLANCTQVLEIMEKTGFPCYLKALEQVGVPGVT